MPSITKRALASLRARARRGGRRRSETPRRRRSPGRFRRGARRVGRGFRRGGRRARGIFGRGLRGFLGQGFLSGTLGLVATKRLIGDGKMLDVGRWNTGLRQTLTGFALNSVGFNNADLQSAGIKELASEGIDTLIERFTGGGGGGGGGQEAI